MTDKEKCVLSIDWSSVFTKFNKTTKASADIRHPQSRTFIELTEQAINDAATKLIEEHDKDKFRSVRYAYQYGKHKLECIKEMRTIDKTLSLKEAVDIVNSWGI